MSVPEERPPRPAFAVLKRAAVAAVAITLLTSASVATAVLLEVKDAVDVFVRSSMPIPGIQDVLADVEPGGPQTILVLGSDRRYVDIKTKTPPRSDTIMLVRLDPSKGATAVMSVPRDLRVRLPGSGRTTRINEAYTVGGPRLAVRTVSRVLDLPINRVVNVNFGGFQRAVNRLGCVYVDVDRRYYHSNEGLPPSEHYAEIDLRPGYQRLCGSDSLDYVRYRHEDNDFVRSARQQDFLRQAKDQIGLGTLFGDREELLRIFGRYTQTDIDSNTEVLRLLKLAFESAQNPIQQIPFRATDARDAASGADYVVSTPSQLRRNVRQFLSVEAPRKRVAPPRTRREPTRRARRRATTTSVPGLVASPALVKDQTIRVGLNLGFPAYYPKLSLSRARYDLSPASDAMGARRYRIRDRGGKRYRAYRLVAWAGDFGQYYGIQGTSWTAPPILDNPSEVREVRGRKLELFFDGSRLRLVAWRTPRAAYWVSNTLTESLTNRQMIGIARSLSRLGT